MEARVLIIEDEALIALHLEQLIIEAGHRVIGIAFDPEEAKIIARAERPDFAFVDMRLRGGTNGLEAARHLREEYDVPSILVSGNLDNTNIEAAAGLEPIALIGKPFMPVAIAGAIDMALASIALHRS
jgi:DNA-binding NarL/FixJ family response regulator